MLWLYTRIPKRYVITVKRISASYQVQTVTWSFPSQLKKKIQHSYRTKANSFVLSLFSLVFWSIIIVNFENQYRGQKGCELDLFIRRVYGWASWSESEKQGFSTNSWVWWFENCKFQNIGLSFHTASLAFATIFPL